MKVNVLYSMIAVAISALITYGIYYVCRNENALFLAVGCFIFVGFPLFLAMGVSSTSGRTSVNMKVLALVFFVVLLITNIVFAILPGFAKPVYIIANGIANLVCLLIFHGIYKTGE